MISENSDDNLKKHGRSQAIVGFDVNDKYCVLVTTMERMKIRIETPSILNEKYSQRPPSINVWFEFNAGCFVKLYSSKSGWGTTKLRCLL